MVCFTDILLMNVYQQYYIIAFTALVRVRNHRDQARFDLYFNVTCFEFDFTVTKECGYINIESKVKMAEPLN